MSKSNLLGPMFNPSIEHSRFWTLRGNPAILTGRRLKRENAKFKHNGVQHGVIFLNIGDTHLEKDIIVPSLVKEAVHRAIESQRICYTFSEGEPDLIKSVAHHYGVSESEVFILNGVTEAIFFLARLFARIPTGDGDLSCSTQRNQPWHNIMLIRPVYPPWSGILLEHGIALTLVDRYTDGARCGQPCLEEIKEKINPATLAVVLISADNPTGKVLTRQTVENIARILKYYREKKGQTIFMIVDDIYRDFVEPDKRVDFLKISNEYKVPLLLLGGIDKILGTGFHGGWLVVHIPRIPAFKRLSRQTLEAIRILFSKYLGANTITQYAMKPYFDESELVRPDVKKNIDKFRLWSDKFIKGLLKLEKEKLLKFKYGVPELPLYLWLEILNFRKWGSATRFAEALVTKTGILVAPGDPFGDNKCIRISVVRDPVKPLNIPQIMLNFMKSAGG
ncbi:MAG: pyridoxal phosphate-dependent aminotransferase [Planctomycetota bacterium]